MPHSPRAVEDVFVRAITYQAKEVLSFELRRIDGGELPPFTAGAHIEVVLPSGVVRSYSLVNSQHERHRYVIAISRDPASRGGSRYLHDNVRPGDSLQIGAPRNNFSLNESAESSLFIAGGIGVTPVLSMIRRLEALGRKWALHYATRGRKCTAFLQEVIDLSRRDPGSLQLHFDDERPGQFLDLRAIVSRADAATHLYCCGPAPMLQAFEAVTSEWPRDQIHIEYFSPKSPPAVTGGFELVLSRSGRTLHVAEAVSYTHLTLPTKA